MALGSVRCGQCRQAADIVQAKRGSLSALDVGGKLTLASCLLGKFCGRPGKRVQNRAESRIKGDGKISVHRVTEGLKVYMVRPSLPFHHATRPRVRKSSIGLLMIVESHMAQMYSSRNRKQ